MHKQFAARHESALIIKSLPIDCRKNSFNHINFLMLHFV